MSDPIGSIQLCQERSSLPAADIGGFIDNYQITWNNINELISKNLQQLTDPKDKTILLHSNSSTICGIFKEIAELKHKVRIIQTESRPVMEGRIQASRLAELGFQVTIITDASVNRYMEQADIAILGADAVYPEYFINKSGSHSIALACRDNEKSCLVVCDSRKLWLNQYKDIPAGDAHNQPAPSHEVWNDPPANVIIENHYFERIPNRLINWFVFEDQTIAGNHINELVR